VTTGALAVLGEALLREKRRVAFYRELSAEAEAREDPESAERLNALLADEQHHLARLFARILELGGKPPEGPGAPEVASVEPSRFGGGGLELDGWEALARRGERDEVQWYEGALEAGGLDPATRDLLREILASERSHERELRGKWMPA